MHDTDLPLLDSILAVEYINKMYYRIFRIETDIELAIDIYDDPCIIYNYLDEWCSEEYHRALLWRLVVRSMTKFPNCAGPLIAATYPELDATQNNLEAYVMGYFQAILDRRSQ